MHQGEAIEEAYKKSVELLKNNSTKFGFLASSVSADAIEQNYLSIFGRDASICVIGALLSSDKNLILTAKRTILTLAKYQTDIGQIPNYVQPEKELVDFWYLGCADSTLWWLLAIKHYDKLSGDKVKLEKKLKKKIDLAINWLLAQEHQGIHLIVQNEASDWADNMPREGMVLYTNVLWLRVKKLYKARHLDKTKAYFDIIFNLKKEAIRHTIREHARKNHKEPCKVCSNIIESSNYFVSFQARRFRGCDVDVYANILACLFNIPSKNKSAKIVKYLIKKRANAHFPIRVLLNPITQDSKLWRRYMEEYATDKPFLYHNGGYWPYVGGFWVTMLGRMGYKKLAGKELEKLAEANKVNDWEFNEWFHGKTGKPMGMKGQSWNAATYIVAYKSLFK